MSSQAAAPGTEATPHAVPDGRPLALARPERYVAPPREPRESRRPPLTPEHVALLSRVRETTDAMIEAEAALDSARDERARAILDALRDGLTLARVGEHAQREPGDPPLSRHQLNRIIEPLQPWKD